MAIRPPLIPSQRSLSLTRALQFPLCASEFIEKIYKEKEEHFHSSRKNGEKGNHNIYRIWKLSIIEIDRPIYPNTDLSLSYRNGNIPSHPAATVSIALKVISHV